MPSQNFKILLGYVQNLVSGSKDRLVADARAMVEDNSKIPFDGLEGRLIEETTEGKDALRSKILAAKLKRAEKVAALWTAFLINLI